MYCCPLKVIASSVASGRAGQCNATRVCSKSDRSVNKLVKSVATMFPLSVVVCSALLAVAAATDVQQCPGGRTIENLKADVLLEPCKRLPCPLKKGTTEFITIKFKPEKEIKELKNHVTADVFGVPLPFIGVDGGSVCDKLQTETGEKTSCPLTAGTTYVYKDSFPVLGIYPNIEVKVHWALQAHGSDVTCFEVPAKIK